MTRPRPTSTEQPAGRPRLVHRVRSAANSALARVGLARSAVRPTVSAVRETAADARRSRLPQMAAALAFRTLFSLIPMIVVGLVLLRSFATDEDIEKVLSRAFEYAGINEIAVEDRPVSAGPQWMFLNGVPVAVPAAAAPGADEPVPAPRSARLDKFIRDLVQRVSSIPFVKIGWLGLILLFYAAISMLVEVERAFNQIYRVPLGRSWARRITQYWTLLTLGTAFLVATFFVGEQFKSWAIRLTESQGFGGGGITVAFIGFGVTVAISTLLFLLAYTTVPNTRVALPAALAGAFVAGILWETGKWGFTQYLRMSSTSGYARLYGSVALIPLFMLWVYVTWVIALFGLQVAYHIQHVRQRTIAQPNEALEPAIVDPAAMLSLMARLAERFDKGESADAPQLAAQLRLQRPIVKQMLDRLAEAGLVHRLESEEGPDGHERFVLARPPQRISAEDVLTLAEELAGDSEDGGRGGLALAMRRSRHDAVRGKDLASLVDGNGAPAAEDRPGSQVEAPGARSVVQPG